MVFRPKGFGQTMHAIELRRPPGRLGEADETRHRAWLQLVRRRFPAGLRQSSPAWPFRNRRTGLSLCMLPPPFLEIPRGYRQGAFADDIVVHPQRTLQREQSLLVHRIEPAQLFPVKRTAIDGHAHQKNALTTARAAAAAHSPDAARFPIPAGSIRAAFALSSLMLRLYRGRQAGERPA